MVPFLTYINCSIVLLKALSERKILHKQPFLLQNIGILLGQTRSKSGTVCLVCNTNENSVVLLLQSFSFVKQLSVWRSVRGICSYLFPCPGPIQCQCVIDFYLLQVSSSAYFECF